MTKHKRHSYLVIQEQHILVVLLGSPLDGEKKAVTNGTAFLLVLSQSSSTGESIIFPDGSSWMQVGELIVIRGDADGVEELMTTFYDPHNGNGSIHRPLWKHTFPKPFPHKCLQVFWWTNDGSDWGGNSDTYYFVDSNSALEADGFGTQHKHVKYIAFGY